MKLEKENRDVMITNPKNWKGPFYFNRKDYRLLVPKNNPSMGWTLNFASPFAYLTLGAIILIFVAMAFLKKG